MFDLLVRNGTVVTAEGSYPYDVAITEGKVAAMGPHGSLGEARETVDAAGKLVLPGLIDPQELFVPLIAGACAFFLGQLTLWLYQRTLLAILDLACGLFLCMSALGAPNQMLGLLWAAVPCLLVSVAVLPSRRRQRTTPFEKEARNLLAKYQDLKPHTIQAVFDHQGLTVSQPEGNPSVYPYSTVSFCVETPDLLLPFFQETVLLLPKYDLTPGTMDQLRTMLAQQAPYEILE